MRTSNWYSNQKAVNTLPNQFAVGKINTFTCRWCLMMMMTTALASMLQIISRDSDYYYCLIGRDSGGCHLFLFFSVFFGSSKFGCDWWILNLDLDFVYLMGRGVRWWIYSCACVCVCASPHIVICINFACHSHLEFCFFPFNSQRLPFGTSSQPNSLMTIFEMFGKHSIIARCNHFRRHFDHANTDCKISCVVASLMASCLTPQQHYFVVWELEHRNGHQRTLTHTNNNFEFMDSLFSFARFFFISVSCFVFRPFTMHYAAMPVPKPMLWMREYIVQTVNARSTHSAHALLQVAPKNDEIKERRKKRFKRFLLPRLLPVKLRNHIVSSLLRLIDRTYGERV